MAGENTGAAGAANTRRTSPPAPQGGPGAKTGTKDSPVKSSTPTTSTTSEAKAIADKNAAAAAAAAKKAADKRAADKRAADARAAAAKKAADKKAADKKAADKKAADKKVADKAKADAKAAAAAKAKADADKAKADAKAEQFATAGAVFRSTLKTFFPGAENDAWINQLFEAAKPRVTAGFDTNQILDLMLQNGETPKKFNDRFSGIFQLDKRRDAGETVYVPSIAEYIAGEEEYTRLVTKFGMANLGTIQNYGKIVGNDVSIDEVTDRIADATRRVNELDSATMEQLRTEFPNLKQSDLVQSILNKETPQDLQNRITRAEIGVEAKQAGVTSMLGTQTLQEAGVTRAEARKGFQALADYQRIAGAGIQQAQAMFGDTTTTEDFQTELEKEALLGQTSKTRKRLESQARAQFGGQSGIATGSLGRKKQV